MQGPGLNCERDEYPPVGFWQDQDIHDQWIRMVPKNENSPAGAALFGLGLCSYDAKGKPPAQTRNIRFDRRVNGPDRITEFSTGDVTTTLATVSIRFDAYPNQPDFGLTANPCWPSTLIDDPGFALLTSDLWYVDVGNGQRHQTASLYSNPPPARFTQNNPPRAGYQKRSLDSLDMGLTFDKWNITHKLTEEALAELGICEGRSTNCVDKLEDLKISSVYVVPQKVSRVPRASEAEPTAADSVLAPAATSTAPMVGGGAQSALNAILKPTRGTE